MTKFHTCPEMQEFRFSFKGKCRIASCQFNNNITPSGCLTLDRKEAPTKTITDAELQFYKCPELNERQVFTKRRSQIVRIKSLIVLSSFIEWIVEKYDDCGTEVKGRSDKIDQYLSEYPLALKALRFPPWVLRYLLDEDCYNAFYSENVKIPKSEVNFKNVLGLTTKKLQALRSEVNLIFK